MTKLVASLLCDGPAATIAAAETALARGADWVEIRLDSWADQDAPFAPVADALPAGQWMVTCRSGHEGGCSHSDTQHRVARLLEAGRCGHAYVDFEYADWKRSANIRQKARLAATEQDSSRLILSAHQFKGRFEDATALLGAMNRQQDVAAAKLAWQPENICDNLLAFDLLRGSSGPAIVICMGEAGLMSRVLAGKLGAFATYCAPATGAETAPGQLTLDDMLQRYRWRDIDESTQVFGVIGYPVAHSMSPALFNACFERHGINAVYLPLLVDPSPGVLERFITGCAERPWLHANGFSVTMPHKEAAAKLLGGRMEPRVRRIGAVNTLVAGDKDYSGFNTDSTAALEAITNTLSCAAGDFAGVQVAILGAGGVARAIVAGLRDHGARVTLYNRTLERAQSLAEEFGCSWAPWESRAQLGSVDLLVNCTSVGMWPNVDESPSEARHLTSQPVVFDTVYNPVETRLLREAEQAGCRTIDGLTLFVNQAAAQFELWTQQKADQAFMRRTVEANLPQ